MQYNVEKCFWGLEKCWATFMPSENFPWLPDPVLMTADHNHYQTLEQILDGQLDTTDKDIRPSASNRTVAAVAEELQFFFQIYIYN